MELSLATTEGWAPNRAMTNKRARANANDRLLGRALSVLRRRARLSQQSAAEAQGVTAQGWQNYEAGKRSSIFSLTSLPSLTAAVQATPDDLMRVKSLLEAGMSEALLADPDYPLPTGTSGGEVVVFPPRGFGETAEPFRHEALAPVYGGVHAGDPKAIAFTPDRPDDWKPLHPNQMGYREPFYVEVLSDSLSPRFERGEYAPGARGVRPRRGQVCVIETHDGAMLLKYYEGQDSEVVHLRELHPEPRDIKIHLSEVRAVHAVVGGAV